MRAICYLVIAILLSGCVNGNSAGLMPEPQKTQLVIRDESNQEVTPKEAKDKLKTMLETEKRLPVKIFLSFWINHDLDSYGQMELWYTSACTVSSGGSKLSTEGKPIYEEGVGVGQETKVGQVFATNVSADVDSIACAIKLIEDDGLSTTEGEAADKLSKDLSAFVQGVGTASSMATWIPILPIATNLIDLLAPDENLRTANVTLLRSDFFAPEEDTVIKQGAGVQTAFVIKVGPYRYFRADTATSPSVIQGLQSVR